MESVRTRPPARTSPARCNRSSITLSSASARPATASRARNSHSTVSSKPVCSNSRPRAYFQEIRSATACAASRSERWCRNCRTVTIASSAGESPGCPSEAYMSSNSCEVKSSSANSGPSASRTRISSVPCGCTFRANAAVSTGTSGTPTGRSTHRSSREEPQSQPPTSGRPLLSHAQAPRLRQQSQTQRSAALPDSLLCALYTFQLVEGRLPARRRPANGAVRAALCYAAHDKEQRAWPSSANVLDTLSRLTKLRDDRSQVGAVDRRSTTLEHSSDHDLWLEYEVGSPAAQSAWLSNGSTRSRVIRGVLRV